MDVFATDLEMINFMKIGSDSDNVLSVMTELYSKVKNTKGILSKVFQSCDICAKIKAMIKPDATVKDITDAFQQYPYQEWSDEFKNNLLNCTTSSTTTKLDVDKACASLTTCYDKAFLRLFGFPLLANSLYSLFQSYKMWRLIDTFIVSSYESRIKSAKEKLHECAKLCKPMIDLEILNQEQVKDLRRIEELLGDIKSIIEFITEDITNKIAEAKRLRSNSFVSFLVNAASFFMYGTIATRVENITGDDSYSSIVMKLSTVIQAGCTLGDLIHSGKANILINQLEKQLNVMKQLDIEQKRLSDDYKKLSTLPVQV